MDAVLRVGRFMICICRIEIEESGMSGRWRIVSVTPYVARCQGSDRLASSGPAKNPLPYDSSSLYLVTLAGTHPTRILQSTMCE